MGKGQRRISGKECSEGGVVTKVRLIKLRWKRYRARCKGISRRHEGGSSSVIVVNQDTIRAKYKKQVFVAGT